MVGVYARIKVANWLLVVPSVISSCGSSGILWSRLEPIALHRMGRLRSTMINSVFGLERSYMALAFLRNTGLPPLSILFTYTTVRYTQPHYPLHLVFTMEWNRIWNFLRLLDLEYVSNVLVIGVLNWIVTTSPVSFSGTRPPIRTLYIWIWIRVLLSKAIMLLLMTRNLREIKHTKNHTIRNNIIGWSQMRLNYEDRLTYRYLNARSAG